MDELVSIVIPVYNVKEYLHRCLDSVTGQTYQHLEIILIDDGSTDGSGDICEEYALKDCRIRVYHTENGGLSSARNKGVSYVKGHYLAFIDSDDYVAEDMIEMLLHSMLCEHSDLVICNFLRVDEKGQVLTEVADSPIKDELLETNEALNKLCGSMYWYYVTAWNRLYRTEIIREIPFPENQINEDELTAHYLLGKCRKVSCIAKPLYYYVQRENSITRGRYTIQQMNTVTAMLDRCIYASRHHLHELAKCCMDRGMYLYLEGYQKLDVKDVQIQDRLKQLSSQFKDAYMSMDKATLSIKKKCLYHLFLMNYRVYFWLDKRIHSQ